MEYNKEIKVRIDQIRCEKYKTIQPELPTKKFMFPDERESVHNIKLIDDNSSDQNKATTADSKTKNMVEEPADEQVEMEEEVEEVRKAMTGMFRDDIRRIDLVLVVEDDVNELSTDIKFNFLSYIVKAGLEVEVEPGVMTIHENLTFIKIHAPDSVLETYGKFFGTKRYFADTRYDYMDHTMKYDKEWVMLVRKNYETPYGYSNYERSIIVYKILLHLSFGDNANYYGIERLLNRKIIVDVFALHDGPYFITPDQTISGSNARQILNYYWSRIQNVFHQQPIHLIHEYFGPRLAFYFAFYEFFTKALKVAAFVGILHTILGILNLTVLEKDIKKSICESTNIICESCRGGCLRRVCNEYCLSVKMHLILDHLLIPLYSVFTVVGSFIFVRLWQRREYFLKWIWEVGRHDSYYKNAVRPLFDNMFGLKKKPFIAGLKYSECVIPIFLRSVVSKIIIIFYWYTMMPLMIYNYRLYLAFSINMATESHPEKYRDYIVMSMFQTFYILLMTVFEKIYHYIVYFIVTYENHSSRKKFTKSIVVKEFGFKMFYQYALIIYYTCIHGNHPRYRMCYGGHFSPLDNILEIVEKIYTYDPDDVCDNLSFCFPYSCVIEVATLLATLLIVTQVVYKMFDYVFCLRTDYNQKTYIKSDIPCWEREYRLSSWTEEDMVRRYVNLAAQFTLVTWFVIAFPLGPLILYIMNVWDLRHEARKLLLASRRPLLIKTPGTQMTNVFYFIASVGVLTNAICIATVTRTGLRYLMHKLGKKQDELLNLFHFYFADMKCYAPDLLRGDNPSYLAFKDLSFAEVFYKIEFIWLSLYRLYHWIIFVLAMGCLILLVRYTIPLQKEVKIVRALEYKIRNQYYHYEYITMQNR